MLGFHHREFSAQLANSRRDFLAELGPDFRQWMGASGHSAATVKRAALSNARGRDGGVR
jgi:hypothetical protein